MTLRFTIDEDGDIVLVCPDCDEQVAVLSDGDEVETDEFTDHVENCEQR